MTAPRDPLLPLGDGHTPLDGDDHEGLKLTDITTRSELNEAEQANILRARHGRRRPTLQALLDDKYLRDLHRAMFGEVWAWACSYRRLETSIGIDPARIAAHSGRFRPPNPADSGHPIRSIPATCSG